MLIYGKGSKRSCASGKMPPEARITKLTRRHRAASSLTPPGDCRARFEGSCTRATVCHAPFGADGEAATGRDPDAHLGSRRLLRMLGRIEGLLGDPARPDTWAVEISRAAPVPLSVH